MNTTHFKNTGRRNKLALYFLAVAEQQVAETGTNPAPWTPEEQKLLEQALRTYPASTPERWEKIASVLPARSKKDCMKRYKVSFITPVISCKII